jgi:hypothetical protein
MTAAKVARLIVNFFSFRLHGFVWFGVGFCPEKLGQNGDKGVITLQEDNNPTAKNP